MYVDTIFGIRWRDAVSSTEITVGILIIVLVIIAYSLYKYNLQLQNKIIHARLLFQFKIKHLGLTGLQIRIVNHIVENQKLKNPQIIFTNPDLFEASIGEMLDFLKCGTEDGDSLVNICKDLIITYEKIYHHIFVRKPIEKISDIEEGVLLYFYLNPSIVYVGKLIEKEASQMTLQLFRNIKDLPKIEIDGMYDFYFWRSGDAEYIFKAKVLSYENGRVVIEMPLEFTRGKEVRRPYIDVFIQCILSLPAELNKSEEETETIPGTIVKLNEHELVMRLVQKLDYLINYNLNFKIDEFIVNTSIQLIADKTVIEGDTHFYTCKIIEISEAAKIVLHKFINDSF
jgi:hypothetical protein